MPLLRANFKKPLTQDRAVANGQQRSVYDRRIEILADSATGSRNDKGLKRLDTFGRVVS